MAAKPKFSLKGRPQVIPPKLKPKKRKDTKLSSTLDNTTLVDPYAVKESQEAGRVVADGVSTVTPAVDYEWTEIPEAGDRRDLFPSFEDYDRCLVIYETNQNYLLDNLKLDDFKVRLDALNFWFGAIAEPANPEELHDLDEIQKLADREMIRCKTGISSYCKESLRDRVGVPPESVRSIIGEQVPLIEKRFSKYARTAWR